MQSLVKKLRWLVVIVVILLLAAYITFAPSFDPPWARFVCYIPLTIAVINFWNVYRLEVRIAESDRKLADRELRK